MESSILASLIGIAARGALGSRGEGWWRNFTTTKLQNAFFAIVDLLNIQELVEVGAFDATISRTFLERGKKSAVAFEANPYTFFEFTASAKSCGVDVRNLAVGDKNSGFVDIFIPLYGKNPQKTPLNASLLERMNEQHPHESSRVPMVTLDDSISFPSACNVALWIDVEGMADRVLIGGKNFLQSASVRLVFVEVESELFWRNGSTVDQIDALLREHDLVPILRDAQAAGQFNQIYVREDDITYLLDEIARYWNALSHRKLFHWCKVEIWNIQVKLQHWNRRAKRLALFLLQKRLLPHQ
jgi:FkbM family methyltransferase